jgi:hypothetical protein
MGDELIQVQAPSGRPDVNFAGLSSHRPYDFNARRYSAGLISTRSA